MKVGVCQAVSERIQVEISDEKHRAIRSVSAVD